MLLIVFLDVWIAASLAAVTFAKGFERCLPLAAFYLLIFPNEAQLEIGGVFDLTTQRVVVLVLTMLWVLMGRTATPRRSGIPMGLLMGAYAAWMLLSSANSVVPWISFKSTVSQCFDFFLLYGIYLSSISSVKMLYRVLEGVVAGMLFCSVLGTIEAYTDWSPLSLFPNLVSRFSDLAGVVNDRGQRVQSTSGHPILFGATLAMGIPLALHLLTQAQTQARRVYLWSAILLMILCLYKTGSRGPWLAFLIACAVLLVAGYSGVRRHLAVIAALTIAILVTRPGVTQSIADMYAATRDPTSPEGQSYQWRYLLYHLAQQELGKSTERALWGYGPESFYYLNLSAPFLVDGEERQVSVLSCDSAVVEVAMDTGYVGLLLLTSIFAGAALSAIRLYRRVTSQRPLMLVLLVTLGAFCFMMTNVELYGWGQQNYLLWIVIALMMAGPNISELARDQALVAPADSYWRTAPSYADYAADNSR